MPYLFLAKKALEAG